MPTSMNQYELTFILDEKAGVEEGKKKTAELTAFVEKFGGKVTKEEPWGRRELAYEINRNRSGYYVTLWMDLPSASVRLIEQELRFDESIIRSLVTKAYTVAQPGSLYPVVEEPKSDKPAPRGVAGKEDKTSAEEMLRRTATAKAPKKTAEEEADASLPEDERLKKLDETLDVLLKDEA